MTEEIRARKRKGLTEADRRYYEELRYELSKGPFGMCDPIEYAPPDETEKRIEELKAQLRKKS